MSDLAFLIGYYLGELYKRRWLMLWVAWGVLLAGVFIAGAIPDTFRSRAVIFVDTQSLLAQILKNDAVIVDPARQVEQVRRIMYARPTLEELMRRSDLDLYINDEKERDVLIAKLEKNIQFNPQLRDFYEVSYEHRNPKIARTVVQNLLSIFIERNLERGAGNSEATLGFLESQRTDLQESLRSVLDEIADYQRRYPDEVEDFHIIVDKRDRIEAELRRLRTERALESSQVDLLRADLAATPRKIEIAAGGVLATHRTRYRDLLLERDTMLAAGRTARHPDVVAMERLIAQARADLDFATASAGLEDDTEYDENPAWRQIETYISRATFRIDAIDAQIALLEEDLKRVNLAYERQPEIKFRFDGLIARQKDLEGSIKDFTAKIESATISDDIIRGANVIDFRIVEPPRVPQTPSGPDRALALGAVLFAALALSVGLALTLTVLSSQMPTLVHLKNAFELPILGAVSEAEPSGAGARGRIGALGLAAGVTGLALFAAAAWYAFVVAAFRIDLGALFPGDSWAS